MKKIIYDVGSNNGDDIPYYLMKGDIVVAIEANPVLCEDIKHKFTSDIQKGRLFIENCVVTDFEGLGEIDFYLHKTNHVLSQLPIPTEEISDQFTCVRLPSKSILSIIKKYGLPYYIKIDIENYDAPLLRAIFIGEIHPPFISAESHNLDVFLTLAVEGRYNAFKLVDGRSVPSTYINRSIDLQSSNQKIAYSFPVHSAGPFGNDIDGEWLPKETFFKLLAYSGLGWKDIHATNIENPNPLANPRIIQILNKLISFIQLFSYTRHRIRYFFKKHLKG